MTVTQKRAKVGKELEKLEQSQLEKHESWQSNLN